MIRFIAKWIGRLIFAVLLFSLFLAVPVAVVEVQCRGNPVSESYESLLPEEHRRAEARTLLTYPEWHIVHAYDDYAAVIADGDPHDFSYLKAIAGFWSSLCALKKQAQAHGGFDAETKQMIYVIGVSFTAELSAKGIYEETVGRGFAALRGAERSALDEVSARQAAEYADFLQQIPWYKWDFVSDGAELVSGSSGNLRDWERRLALGADYAAKAAYANAIADAVAEMEPDALTLRMVVTGLTPELMAANPEILVMGVTDAGVEIETPRYRALTRIMAKLADSELEFVEIAGNDDIMFTYLSGSKSEDGALFSFARQGYGDFRHLEVLKVGALAGRLRSLSQSDASLEHIHDY